MEEVTKVPIVYLIFLQRFSAMSFNDMIEVHRARRLLTMTHHIPRDKVSTVLREMKELGLIESNGQRHIKLMKGRLAELEW